jgi:GT2 family glycosyltransferase
MDSGDSPTDRVYVVTNESYIRNTASPRGFSPVDSVSFTILPGAVNIGKVEILTRYTAGSARLTLEITDVNGKRLLRTKASDAAHDGYTVFEFFPVIHLRMAETLEQNLLKLTVSSQTAGGGVLVNRSRRRQGFDVEGGGMVVCRVYTRLDALYMHWLVNNAPTEEELAGQRAAVFARMPKVSVISPLYNTPEPLLREMIQSVTDQTYANWELCLADGSTDGADRRAIAESYGDTRIRYEKLEKNEGISGNSNHAIGMSTGEYIALLDHDDTITSHALYRSVETINRCSDCDFIYSDEDKLSADGKRRFSPFFKPDFSPDMLNAFNYITHFTVIKKSLLDQIGLFQGEYNGAQDYDLFLRATEAARRVCHIDDVLYNWRVIETSTAFSSESKSYTAEAGKAALEASIARRGVGAHAEMGVLPNYYRVAYDIPDPRPLISVMIPNHNEKAALKTCLDSIRRKSSYPNYEILIVENNSTQPALLRYYESLQNDPRVRVIGWHHPFNFSALNNFAASQAKGELLLFMNNDMSVISPDWLEQMAMHALRPEIGEVGAKLLYPDNTLQHGGIVLRIGGIAGHSHKFIDAAEVGAFARMAIVHNVSAVTGACAMMRKSVFERAGGFDERFTVAYNDVDLGLKIGALGLRNLWTPYAQLYHYESRTRGYEDTQDKKKRLAEEAALWLSKWEAAYPSDPYYSRNLTLVYEDHSISPDRVER